MNFRDLHHGDRPLLLPNAWDFASGAALAAAGFPAVATTSLGVAVAAGKQDARGGTVEETMILAYSLARLPAPVSVDIEGGFFDDPKEVGDLVAELASYGIAGINIEDGRPTGPLASTEHHTAVIAAVKQAAPDVFVNARTDTYWQFDQGSAPETLSRAKAYADAGADGIFVPGAATDADIEALVTGIDLPLNVLYMPGKMTYEHLADLGVSRISTGSLLFRAALNTAVTTALEITNGPVDRPIPSYSEVMKLVD
ncbi:isocitrate lyase/phosphoenolpyruvate mutase family protein [Actinomadura barringtoniae]|uniref:Isocitrate lyase/phosphoenolpyruvate mutase family protein n=1 Tax=Actinomadura barringtoniae TaxID=1427535 RepID=A0A939PCG2_9ACTN|nr:isocitrate lyase/phosphoenolpyruvate mutase family protein [Actinomadura barringtoniae]MBO2450050.1 isocitrate lyase/phosphoenolpyruvate mutase family protein [Actinomadura barringtoniae]